MSNKIYFVDCSHINLLEMCNIILNSNFFVGNNSGPTTLASALNIKSYNLVSSTSVKELKFGTTIPIVPDDYVDPIDSTIKKIGDNFIKSRNQMKKITPQKVFNTIFNSYK
jgi:ADP-heptose:LPS heptosyltransferase